MIFFKKNIVGLISKCISVFVPRCKTILFFSYPNYTDNAYAVFKYIVENNKYPKHKLVWIIDYNEKDATNAEKSLKKEHPDVTIIKRGSLSSFWYYYSCRYFFFTHSLYSSLPTISTLKRIDLWHGMPLKNIGCLQDDSGSVQTRSDVILATSDLFQDIMARAFKHPKDKVVVCGLPRNDMFDRETNFFENEGIDFSKYKKIGMWLPTYKVSVGDNGELVKDGHYVEGVAFLDREGLKKFNTFLSERNYLIVIKLHPMDLLNTLELPNYSNIRIYKSFEFNYQLYPVLGKVDFLLTDYSSVWVDYEILNKPIGFVIDDIKEYESNRGFTVENLISKLPGSVIEDYPSLCDFLDSSMDMTERNNIWNKNKDFNSSERLINYLEHGHI